MVGFQKESPIPGCHSQSRILNFGGLLLSWKLTVRAWKWMVGILFSFCDGIFSGAMSVSGKVNGSFMTHFGREWNEWNLMHMLRFWGIAPKYCCIVWVDNILTPVCCWLMKEIFDKEIRFLFWYLFGGKDGDGNRVGLRFGMATSH